MNSSSLPPRSELKSRLERFREIMHRREISSALITDERNVRYLSGFTGTDSALLITGKRKFLLTDFRFIEEASNTAPGWRKILKPRGLMEKAGTVAKKQRLRRLAVEPGDMRMSDIRELRKFAKGVKVRPQDAMVAELRLCKSPWEVTQIENALRIQEACFKEICKALRPGMSERDAAAELRYRMTKAGADDESFACMFQLGSHSSLPHGRPTGRKFTGDAVILVDWGAKLNGYHSDLTRTFFMGSIPPKLRHIHSLVLEAQRQAIERIAPGVEFSDVDKVARSVIAKGGFGKQFGHSTGHGIGLNVHEAPTLSARGKGQLAPGMIVTVEPGIYLPGVGGVRIEDDVLVTETGRRVLSRIGKGLRWDGTND